MVPFHDLQGLVPDGDRSLPWFAPCKGEMIGGIKLFRLFALKHQG